MLPSAGDLARWAFWVHLRGAVPVRHPSVLRATWPLWRLQWLAAGPRRELMADELRRSFGAAAADRVEDAYRAGFRSHSEELLLGRVDRDSVGRWMRLDGAHHLDEARERGKGVVIVSPHAGSFMMMIAAISLAGYPYTQYAARGLAPEAVAKEHPEVFGHNRWRQEARAAREASEDRLPAHFLTMDTPIRQLHRCLERNELVAIAYDGRIGTRFVVVDYLGRRALLNPGPFRLAAAMNAAIVPALCHGPPGDVAVCALGRPIYPEGRDARALMDHALRTAFEPWLREHPEEYGIWLLHCRLRAGVDDHPLFVDYAPDDRWRRYERA